MSSTAAPRRSSRSAATKVPMLNDIPKSQQAALASRESSQSKGASSSNAHSHNTSDSDSPQPIKAGASKQRKSKAGSTGNKASKQEKSKAGSVGSKSRKKASEAAKVQSPNSDKSSSESDNDDSNKGPVDPDLPWQGYEDKAILKLVRDESNWDRIVENFNKQGPRTVTKAALQARYAEIENNKATSAVSLPKASKALAPTVKASTAVTPAVKASTSLTPAPNGTRWPKKDVEVVRALMRKFGNSKGQGKAMFEAYTKTQGVLLRTRAQFDSKRAKLQFNSKRAQLQRRSTAKDDSERSSDEDDEEAGRDEDHVNGMVAAHDQQGGDEDDTSSSDSDDGSASRQAAARKKRQEIFDKEVLDGDAASPPPTTTKTSADKRKASSSHNDDLAATPKKASKRNKTSTSAREPSAPVKAGPHRGSGAGKANGTATTRSKKKDFILTYNRHGMATGQADFGMRIRCFWSANGCIQALGELLPSAADMDEEQMEEEEGHLGDFMEWHLVLDIDERGAVRDRRVPEGTQRFDGGPLRSYLYKTPLGDSFELFVPL